jgi:Ca-activated chloride channel family protein
VVYDDDINTILDLMPVSFARSFVEQKVAQVRPGGSTNLHGGWLKGAEILAPKTNDQSCRVILLWMDRQISVSRMFIEFVTQVSELANAGITTTTVGFGLGFNEELMSAMAKAGQEMPGLVNELKICQESFDTELSFLSKLAFKEVEVTSHLS